MTGVEFHVAPGLPVATSSVKDIDLDPTYFKP